MASRPAFGRRAWPGRNRGSPWRVSYRTRTVSEPENSSPVSSETPVRVSVAVGGATMASTAVSLKRATRLPHESAKLPWAGMPLRASEVRSTVHRGMAVWTVTLPLWGTSRIRSCGETATPSRSSERELQNAALAARATAMNRMAVTSRDFFMRIPPKIDGCPAARRRDCFRKSGSRGTSSRTRRGGSVCHATGRPEARDSWTALRSGAKEPALPFRLCRSSGSCLW